jgi:hypothetical protein
MKRRALTAVCVVCLLLIAGCAAPTNAPQSATAVTASDMRDASAVIQAHTTTLQSQPFTARSTTTVRDANSTFHVTINQTWKVDPRRPVRALAVRTSTATDSAPARYRQSPDRVTAWRHGNDTTVRVESGNETEIRQVGLLNSSVRLNRALHRQLLYKYSTRRNATVETLSRNGTNFYRVQASLNDTHIASNASMTLLVNQAGYVTQIETRQTVAYRSGPRVITRTVRFDRIGTTTVRSPSWAERTRD